MDHVLTFKDLLIGIGIFAFLSGIAWVLGKISDALKL